MVISLAKRICTYSLCLFFVGSSLSLFGHDKINSAITASVTVIFFFARITLVDFPWNFSDFY
jgi:hypothetical protein